MKPIGTLLTAVSFAAYLLATGCSTSPLGRSQLHLFSEEAMSEMGAAAFDTIKAESTKEAPAPTSRYITCVAELIVTNLPDEQSGDWEVRVFESDDLNAFALPGRKIGIYTGLLQAARNQDQLATVIGHEVAHVIAQHGNERVSTNFAADTGLQLASALAGDPGSTQSQTAMALLGLGTQVGVLLPFSRAQESEADVLGLELMARAGFEPGASIELWHNMAEHSEGSPPEFLSTHPGTAGRIQALQNHMSGAVNLQKSARSQGRRPNCQPR